MRFEKCRIGVVAAFLLYAAAQISSAQDSPVQPGLEREPANPVAETIETAEAIADQNTEIQSKVAEVQNEVDVRTEVWPILQRHCLRCHNQEQSGGDLRLDEIDQIRAGGHTGNVILGSVDNSELLRRISATDPGYRMPKEGELFSPADVQVLTRWIDQGASWPPNENANAGGALSSQPLTSLPVFADSPDDDKLKKQTWQSWFSEQLDVAMEYQEPMRPLLIAILLFSVFVLFVERRKRQFCDREIVESGDWSCRVRDVHYWIVCFVFLWVGTILIYQVRVARLRKRFDEVSEKLAKRDVWATTLRESEKSGGPYRTKHPPRMGGVYYRGNDERNEALFNGGFYATCKMFLSLRDRNSDALNWNDPIDDETLAVCLEIERSSSATPDLFNDSTMATCFLTLTPDDRISRASVQQANLQVLEAGERWRACYPLRGLAETKGIMSRYKGGIDLCNAGRVPHYGIRYDILIEDGRIAPESEIWMGATFLTGNVVIPQEGKITLREWFDFVPIPEITKQNSTDPELLGITEHLDDQQYEETSEPIDALPVDEGDDEPNVDVNKN